MWLADAFLKIHQDFIGNDLSSTPITDTCVGTEKVFRELWTHDMIMEESDLVEDKKEEMT